MKPIKIYAIFSGLLSALLIANGVLAGIDYVDAIDYEVEYGVDDVLSIITLLSLISVLLCIVQFGAWIYFTEVFPFRLIALLFLAVDIIILLILSYVNGAYLSLYDPKDDAHYVEIIVLSVASVLCVLIRIFLLLYQLYKAERNNKIEPEIELEKPVIESTKSRESIKEEISDETSDGIKLPVKWSKIERKQEYFLFDVPKRSKEYKTVIQDFLDKLDPNKAKHIKLQRIQNVKVYSRYKTYKDQLCKEKPIRKKLCYYGTNDENFIEQICQYGFVDSTSSVLHTEKNGICFSYFSKLFDDRLAIEPKRMFRVKVVVADETTTKDTKIIDRVKNEHFTEYVDGSIFICTNEAQSYPEYLITYTSVEDEVETKSNSSDSTDSSEIENIVAEDEDKNKS